MLYNLCSWSHIIFIVVHIYDMKRCFSHSETYEVEWSLPTHSPLCYIYIPKDPLLHLTQFTGEDTEIANGPVTCLRPHRWHAAE